MCRDGLRSLPLQGRGCFHVHEGHYWGQEYLGVLVERAQRPGCCREMVLATLSVCHLDGQTPSWRVRSPSTTRMGDQMDVQADTGVRASLVPRHTPEGKNQELDQGGKRPQNRGLRGGTSCKRTHALSISNPTPTVQTLVCPLRNGDEAARLPAKSPHPPTLLPGVPASSLPLESGSGLAGNHLKLGTHHPPRNPAGQALGSHFREVAAEVCRAPEPVGWQR